MVRIDIEGDQLVATLTGWDRLWALSGGVRAPLRTVAGVRRDPVAARRPDGLRIPGSYIPGILTAGSYWRPGRPGVWSFWCVHDPNQAIVVDLTEGRYRRWVLQVADPDATVRSIEQARRMWTE
jgi:hypothetical protein